MMRFTLLISFYIFLLPFNISSQCSPPFIEAECYGPKDMNILEAIKWEQKRELQGSSFSGNSFSSAMRRLEKPEYFKLIDSIFQECNKYMIDQFGKENYCEKIRFSYPLIKNRSSCGLILILGIVKFMNRGMVFISYYSIHSYS